MDIHLQSKHNQIAFERAKTSQQQKCYTENGDFLKSEINILTRDSDI